jgi:hypothetical protein
MREFKRWRHPKPRKTDKTHSLFSMLRVLNGLFEHNGTR